MYGDDEFAALVEDIRTNGQREPIVLVDGELVDGRNRMRACHELGIEPKTRNVTAKEAGDVFGLVMSLNFHRRHLKPHEKGAALAAYMARVGAKKQDGPGRPKKSDTVSDSPKTLPAVAKTLGIDERTARRHVQAAEDYAAATPDLRAKVDAGEITPKQAAKATAAREPREDDSDRAARKKAQRTEAQVLEDCSQAIEEAIGTALLAYPKLRAGIAARLRLIEQEVRNGS
ncbi:MAG: ParB/RepB/Spo0J family partition protein [Planctomycetota bacterium]